jgi:hypothetical protein
MSATQHVSATPSSTTRTRELTHELTHTHGRASSLAHAHLHEVVHQHVLIDPVVAGRAEPQTVVVHPHLRVQPCRDRRPKHVPKRLGEIVTPKHCFDHRRLSRLIGRAARRMCRHLSLACCDGVMAVRVAQEGQRQPDQQRRAHHDFIDP